VSAVLGVAVCACLCAYGVCGAPCCAVSACVAGFALCGAVGVCRCCAGCVSVGVCAVVIGALLSIKTRVYSDFIM